MHDLSLVIFTVLSQLAVGGFITLYCLDTFKKDISLKTGRWINISLIAIIGVSLLVSLSHLGRPFEAYRALGNVGNSWLSNEILLFSMYFIGSVVYLMLWQVEKKPSRNIVGGITSVIGVIAVISSAMIYIIPAVPAWNNLSPVLFFLLTSALLGPLFVMSVIVVLENRTIPLFKLVITMVGVSILLMAMYLSVMLAGESQLLQAGEQMLTSGAFWIRGVLSWILPVLLFIPFMWNKKDIKYNSTAIIVAVFLMVFIGELIGRTMFYNTSVPLEMLKLVQ